jgi:hypothetical protein
MQPSGQAEMHILQPTQFLFRKTGLASTLQEPVLFFLLEPGLLINGPNIKRSSI